PPSLPRPPVTTHKVVVGGEIIVVDGDEQFAPVFQRPQIPEHSSAVRVVRDQRVESELPAPLILLVHAKINGFQAPCGNLRGKGSGAGGGLPISHHPNLHLFQVAVVVYVFVQVEQNGRVVNGGEYNVARLFHLLTL